MRNLLLAMIVPMLGYSTQAWVQNGPTTCHATSGNIACAITGTTSGNTIHIGLGYRLNAATAPTSVVESMGGTTLVASSVNANATVGAWLYCLVLPSSGTETITVTMNGTYFFGNVMIQEFSGSTCTTDGTSGNGGNAPNPDCGSFTPATANNIITAIGYENSGNNDLSAGTGYTTNALILNNGGSSRSAGLEFKVVSSAALQAPVWVCPTSAIYVCTAAAFKTSASPAVFHRIAQ